MNPLRAFELWLLRVLGLGAILGYLLSLFQPPNLPATLQSRPYLCSIGVSLCVNLLDTLILYPKFRDPLRNLPVTEVRQVISENNKHGIKSNNAPCRREIEVKPFTNHPEERLPYDGWNRNPMPNSSEHPV